MFQRKWLVLFMANKKHSHTYSILKKSSNLYAHTRTQTTIRLSTSSSSAIKETPIKYMSEWNCCMKSIAVCVFVVVCSCMCCSTLLAHGLTSLMQNFKHSCRSNSHIGPILQKRHSVVTFNGGKWKYEVWSRIITAWHLICEKTNLKHFCAGSTMKPNEIVVLHLWRIEMHFLPLFILHVAKWNEKKVASVL